MVFILFILEPFYVSWFLISTMRCKVKFAGEAQLQGIIFPLVSSLSFGALLHTVGDGHKMEWGLCRRPEFKIKPHRVCWALSPGCAWGCSQLQPCCAVSASSSLSSAVTPALPRWHFAIPASRCWPLSPSPHLGFVIQSSFLCQNTSGIPGTGPGFPGCEHNKTGD